MGDFLKKVGYLLIMWIAVPAAVNSSTNSYEAVFQYHYRDPGDNPYNCPQDWLARGPDCFKLYEVLLSWEDASDACLNLGAHLADIRFLDLNIFIGSNTASTSDGYWIGYQHSLDGNASYTINWADGQPDEVQGECTTLSNDAENLYPWRLRWCNQGLPFICQMEGWLDDEFHCLNGRHVLEKFTCDRENDCGDNSDEMDCPDENRYFEQLGTMSSRELKSPSYSSFYGHNRDVSWVLEGEVGTRLQLQFTEFKTEAYYDHVDVYTGGSTLSRSHFVASFSGDLDEIQVILSTNNYILVRFVSDNGGSGSSSYRFKAMWSTADSVSSTEVLLTATDTAQVLTSPGYPDSGYPSNMKAHWLIEAQSRWDVVTVVLDTVSVGEEDELTIYDGAQPTRGRELWRAVDGGPYTVVTSGGQAMYLVLRAAVNQGQYSFKLTYYSGCTVELSATSGQIRAPGLASESYPMLQTCGYSLHAPEGFEDRSLTVRLIAMELDSDGDSLTVYDSSRKLLGEIEDDGLMIFNSSNGLYVEFKSDAIASGVGSFQLEYSVGCEDPVFNNDTDAPDFSTSYLSEFSVSCDEGFYFAQEEFNQCGNTIDSSTAVFLSCDLDGKWNVSRLPQCQPVYCGPVPEVANGFVVNLTSVLYQGEVRFGCFEGFTLNGDVVVTCMTDGDWSDAPTCTAATCPILEQADIVSGKFNFTNDKGSNYGSVVRIDCDGGFELTEGQPLIHCNKSGQWTGPTTAACTKLYCPVPKAPAHSSLDVSAAAVTFEIVVRLTCDIGYNIFNTTEPHVDLGCLANQTLEAMPACVDVDECETEAPCESADLCHNTEGSYYCTCPHGYKLNADGKNCDDIDECTEMSDVCDDVCTNEDGSYSCSCPSNGQVLFTEDVQNGFLIKQGETGWDYGDVLRYNHSCISDVCDPLNDTAFGDGTMLVYKRDIFYVGDTVEFLCDLGYGIEGVEVTDGPEKTNLTCQSNGEWSGAVPKCVEIACNPIGDLGHLTNPPVLYPYDVMEAIPFGDTVYMNCSVPGGDPAEFTRSRTCLYDVSQKQYAVIGDPLECGVIDCGMPDDLPGLADDIITETTYNSTFQFTCKQGFNLAPAAADVTVRCQANGRWDLRDLRCEGDTCSDPGRPPDGSAIVTSFEDGQVVVFSCDRNKFEPSPPNMTCTQVGGQMEWLDVDGQQSSIECRDVEDPVITNCPTEPLYVFKYESYNLTAEVTDNSGGWAEVSTNVSAHTPIAEDVTVQWVAEDQAGNLVECVFDVLVASETPPIFPDGCPDSVQIALETPDSQTIDVADYSTPVTPGTPGLTVTNTTDPIQITVDGDDLYKPIQLRQIAEDSLGNTATCIFQALPVPGPCAMWAFARLAPNDGTITFSDDGQTATVQCALGYSFYGADTTSLIYTCDGPDFMNTDQDTYVPECVASVDAEYQMVISVDYVPVDGVAQLNINQEISTAYSNDFTSNVADALGTFLSSKDPCPQESVTVSVSKEVDTTATTVSQFSIETQVQFEGPSSFAVAQCAAIVKVYLDGDLDILPDSAYHLDPANQIDLMAAISSDTNPRFIVAEFQCEGGQVLQQETINGDRFYKCVPCPAGYYSKNNACEKCPRGFFQDLSGQTECQPCLAGNTTYLEGAASQDSCYPVCRSPLVSQSGLAPCTACPRGEYWVNETTCMTCPSGETEGAQGATDSANCREPCEAGQFSEDGFGPNCRPCPLGFYSEMPESMECTPCVGGTTVTVGSNSTDECVAQTAVCGTVTCQNGGECQLDGVTVMCSCAEGFTGRFCEVDIDECASNPCFYDANCTDLPNGYNCTCAPIIVTYMEDSESTSIEGLDYYATDTSVTRSACREACKQDSECSYALHRVVNVSYCYYYSGERTLSYDMDGSTTFVKVFNSSIKEYTGDRCEIEPDDCPADPSDEGFCQNGAGCQDLNQAFQCLCRVNDIFTGPTCNTTLDVCDRAACENGATCVRISDFRYACDCVDGYTGDQCETDIYDCSSTPCLYGGTCTDKVNGFTCECPEGFTGDQCEIRPLDLCTGSPCRVVGVGSVGQCVEDYITSGPLCVCEPGYTSGEYVTRWYDDSSPDEHGEMETLELHGDVCEGNDIVDIKCYSVMTGEDTYQTVECSPEVGLLCYHNNQTMMANCSDYQVRYTCQVNGQSCREVDECTADRCEHSESCLDKLNDYKCNCEDGYHGFHCQKDKDECASNPCQNGGTCEDLVNGYMCGCIKGYTGSRCQNEIDECDSDPCVNGMCVDLVADFRCECEPGFTGYNCTDEIDECLSFPCYHGGNCSHGIDTYSCDCPPGWEGDRCEEMVEVCQPVFCRNGATCFEIFQDHYCDCPTGFTGSDCGQGESICNVADPCLHGSVCDSSTGKALCHDCPNDYTGLGCECLKDYCAEGNDLCENGGVCLVEALGDYTCECPQGFTGVHCAEVETDFCDNVNCRTGDCVNGAESAVCICPYGKSGESCNRDVERDFDLSFRGQGSVKSLHGVFINSSDLTLAMWVRYTSNRGILLEINRQNSYTSRDTTGTVLTIDETVTKFSLSGDQNEAVEIESDVPYMDGRWHSLVVSVGTNGDEHTIRLSVDVASTEMTWTEDVETSATYLSFSLGSRWFSGELSQVQMWDRVLSASEIESIYNAQNTDMTESLKEGLVSDWDWGSFSAGQGSVRVQGSVRGLAVCGPGEERNEAGTCQLMKDKVAPEASDCPTDSVSKPLNDGDRSVTFNSTDGWDHSAIGTGQERDYNYDTGDVFEVGRYEVVYHLFDEERNRASCRFSAVVALASCERVLPADTADVSDAVTCDNGESLVVGLPRDGPQCVEAGVYNIKEPWTSYRLPECGAAVPSDVRTLTANWTYEFCTLNLNTDTHIPLIQGKVEGLIQAWSNGFQESNEFCEAEDSCSNVAVDVSKDTTESGVNHRANVYIVATQVQAEVGDVSMETHLRQAVLQSDSLTVEGVCGDPSTVITLSFVVKSEIYCTGNQQVFNGLCVTCPAGTAYNNVTRSCDWAPVGYYQSQAGQTGFIECPDGNTTEAYGSTTLDECHDICEVGHRYDGVVCAACGLGFYQPLPGQSFCYMCPVGSTTYANTSTSLEQCIDLCGDGEQLMPDQTCAPCPVGKYRRKGNEIECIKCPNNNYTTESTGAITEEDCTVRVCPAGKFVRGDDCVKCPQDSYRTEDMDNCTACPHSHRTETNGTVSIEGCLFYCEAGYYTNNTGNSTCEVCMRDSYKEATDYYATECTSCPNETPRTLDAGATSAEDCRFGRCVAGQYVNPANISECYLCDYGTYQDNPDPVYLVHNCTQCPDNKGTEIRGANSSDFCMTACPSGAFLNSSGGCELCPQGYYKDNLAGPEATFGGCIACPVEFITAAAGAISIEACTVENCTLGQYIDDDGKCQKCEIGYYQDEKWLPACKKCVPEESSTEGEASVSLEQCDVFETPRVFANLKFEQSFTAELEDPDSDVYKLLETRVITATKAALTQMNVLFIAVYVTGFSPGSINTNTETILADSVSNGATVVQQALLGAIQDGTFDPELNPQQDVDARETTKVCSPGEYFDFITVVSPPCKPCPSGRYQPLARAGLCLACPDNKTTNKTGSVSEEDCLRSCPAGEESLDNTQCTPCKDGFIKADAGTGSCTECPTGRITYSDDRTVCRVECVAGSFSAADGASCSVCPEDQYSVSTNQVQCTPCTDNGTTSGQTESDSEDACQNPCVAVSDYCNTGTCVCDGGDCSATYKVTCTCGEYYIGNQCQTRIDPNTSDDNALIIGVTVGVVTAVILLASLFVYCYKTRKSLSKPHKYKKRPLSDEQDDFEQMNPMYPGAVGGYPVGGYPGYAATNLGFYPSPMYSPAMGYYPNYSPENGYPGSFDRPAQAYDNGAARYQEQSGEDFFDTQRAGSLAHDPYTMQAVFQRP